MERSATECLLGLAAVLVAAVGGLSVVPSDAVAGSDGGAYRGTPPSVAVAAGRLGIPSSALDRLEVRWGLPRGTHEPRRGFVSGAYRDGHIFLRRDVRVLDVLAYEYLHDVWAHLPTSQRARVAAMLDDFEGRHRGEMEPEFSDLIRADTRNGLTVERARLDELHSIACSRTRDDHLAPQLRAYCDVVLPGREATTKIY